MSAFMVCSGLLPPSGLSQHLFRRDGTAINRMAGLRRRDSAMRCRINLGGTLRADREDDMRIATRIAAMAAAGWLGLAAAGTAAGAAEIVLVTTDAVKAILNGLIPEFERATGHTVKM